MTTISAPKAKGEQEGTVSILRTITALHDARSKLPRLCLHMLCLLSSDRVNSVIATVCVFDLGVNSSRGWQEHRALRRLVAVEALSSCNGAVDSNDAVIGIYEFSACLVVFDRSAKISCRRAAHPSCRQHFGQNFLSEIEASFARHDIGGGLADIKAGYSASSYRAQSSRCRQTHHVAKIRVALTPTPWLEIGGFRSEVGGVTSDINTFFFAASAHI